MPSENSCAALINNEGFVDWVIIIPYLEDDDEKITKYCNSIGLEGKWVDASFLGKRRGKYPNEGDYFDSKRNIFVSPEEDQDVYGDDEESEIMLELLKLVKSCTTKKEMSNLGERITQLNLSKKNKDKLLEESRKINLS